MKPTLEGYHVLLLQVFEQLLDGLVAAQRGGRAHHQQLVLGPGDGHVQAAPVLQQLAQLQVKGRGRSVTHASSGSFHTKNVVVVMVVVVGGEFWTHASVLCSAPDKRQHDQTFVPALVPVHRIDLHARESRGLQLGRDAL